MGIPSTTEAVCNVTQSPPKERRKVAIRKRVASDSTSDKRRQPFESSRMPEMIICMRSEKYLRNHNSINERMIFTHITQPQISAIVLIDCDKTTVNWTFEGF